MQVTEHGSRRTGDESKSQLLSAIIMRQADAAAYPEQKAPRNLASYCDDLFAFKS
jgi:hypothetical protein